MSKSLFKKQASNDFIKSVIAQKLSQKVTKYDEKLAEEGKF